MFHFYILNEKNIRKIRLILDIEKRIDTIFDKKICRANYITLLNIFLVKSLQIELLAQIHYYDPQSTGINLQSPQSDLTPWTLTLPKGHFEVK